MNIVQVLLLLAGFILFMLSTFNTPSKPNLQSAGLACWILCEVLTRIFHL